MISYGEAINLLYTPLDVPPQPPFELDDLKVWLKESYEKQNLQNVSQLDSGGANDSERQVKEQYPWNLTLAYLDMYNRGPGWINEFDKKFPDLSKWMITSFGLELKDVGSIIMLPTREGHIGQGFWHNDPEPLGIRFYLEFENPESNKLLIRRMKEPYDVRNEFDYPLDIEKITKDPTIECKILHTKQSFFLNNIRAIHSTYTTIPNKTRIAVFVTSKVTNHGEFLQKIIKLALHSAKKYPEYTVWWE